MVCSTTDRHPLTALIAGTLWLACSSTSLGADNEITTDLEDQQSVAVTIYNENLALVKDQRSVDLTRGETVLALRGVSAHMRPETAMLRNTDTADSLRVIEQNFDFDLLTPQKLLEKYTGQSVRIANVNPATGQETIEQAQVLSTQGGVVVRIGNRIETNPTGRIIFDDVPKNLRDQPTLSVQLDSTTQGKQSLELSYLTSGLSWRADYVAELNDDDTQLDLLGWVTLNNTSGASYTNARLQLVAGDVNQVRPELQYAQSHRDMVVTAQRDATDGMREESLFEYHLYTLSRLTSINDQQKKQVSLLTASGVPVKKELLLQGSDYYYRASHGDIGQKMKLGVFVLFNNEKKDGLGKPLPKGVVRVYKRDSRDNAQFVGEDRIDHTPVKENLRLKLGEAFDITADKKQTEFKIVERVMSRDVYDSSYSITINNAKKQPINAIVREPIPGDWTVLKESIAHTKVAAGTAEWRIRVAAQGSTTLTYSVRTKY